MLTKSKEKSFECLNQKITTSSLAPFFGFFLAFLAFFWLYLALLVFFGSILAFFYPFWPKIHNCQNVLGYGIRSNFENFIRSIVIP